MTLETGYFAPIDIDAPKDGAWMCSSCGMHSAPAPLPQPKQFSRGVRIAIALALPTLLALVVWLVRLALQR
ncbi:MAG: hypothetical protein WKG52_00940 [Variovorax sp.]